MGAGESGVHKRPPVWLSFSHLHSGRFFVHRYNRRYISEIQFWVNAVRIHIQCQSNYIRISRSFTVSEQRALNSIRSGQQSKLGIGHAAAAVIVRMQGNDYVLSFVKIFAHILDLTGVNVRKRELHRYRKIYYNLFFRRRFPYLKHLVAYFQSKFGFGSRKAFRRVFKSKIPVKFLRIF